MASKEGAGPEEADVIADLPPEDKEDPVLMVKGFGIAGLGLTICGLARGFMYDCLVLNHSCGLGAVVSLS